MRALALLGLLAAAACGLERGGLDADPDAGSTSHPTSTDDASHVAVGNDATIAQPAEGGDGPSSVAVDATDAAEAGVANPPEAGSDTAADAMDEAPADAADIDAGDTKKPDSGGADASDASEAAAPDAALDAPSGADARPSCVSSIPKGWTVAIYDLGPDTCPTGFTDHDVRGAATVGASACGCACNVAVDGSCVNGTLAAFGDTLNANACGAAWFTVPITADSVCTTIPPSVPATRPIPLSFEAAPLPGQGGTCTSAVQIDPTQLTVASARYCDVPAASAESICNGTVPSGFAACIAEKGLVACPAGTPFVHPFMVEDSATLACGACSACSVSTTCTNAVVTVHTGARCGDTGVAFNVDGTCGPTDFTGIKQVNAVEYTATESSSCSAGTSLASTQLTNPVTICCL